MPVRLTKRIGSAALYFLFSATVFAAQITGTVTNGTSNKPSAGDDVVLLSLSGGMDEVARTKTDAQGRFTLSAPDANGQNLVRVDHQGVNYFQPAPQGRNIVDVTVYDASAKVDNIIGEGHVFRFQTTSDGQLEIFEMFILRNESSPPRTKMGERSFEFGLPAGAKIEDGMAEGPGGMPTSNMPVPAGKKDRYGFVFPIRPGRNRFQVTYKVPYAGIREFKVTPDAPLAELGIMLPKSMQFKSANPDFLPAQDESGMTVFVAKSLAAGKELRFSVSGEGTMPAEGQSGGASQQAQNSAAPGGGLGAPNQAPDPLSRSSWYIIVIFTVVLAGAGYWLFRMQRRTITAPAGAAPAIPQPQSSQSRARQRAAAPNKPGTYAGSNGASGPGVLDAIKEELFQLESDRLQGKVSQQDYETSKAGLEMLIRRHLKKS
ncbi:MAG: carboxypeptidase-like regulatory domain-containing protein [Actinomycetota bacterium]